MSAPFNLILRCVSRRWIHWPGFRTSLTNSAGVVFFQREEGAHESDKAVVEAAAVHHVPVQMLAAKPRPEIMSQSWVMKSAIVL